MNEIINEVKNTDSEKLCKEWHYTEKTNKTTTYHTLSVKGKKFSHVSEIKEASLTMRQRTDFNLDNVRSINSYYGLTRNMASVILCAIIAVIALIAAIAMFAAKSVVVVAVVMLVIAALFAFIAYLNYKNIKPTFTLEIETVVPMGQIATNSFAYGNANVNFGGKGNKISLGKAIMKIIFLPFTIIGSIFKSNANKYKFEMDPEVGLDIVDTLGDYLIKE